jgi:hypothetical protein
LTLGMLGVRADLLLHVANGGGICYATRMANEEATLTELGAFFYCCPTYATIYGCNVIVSSVGCGSGIMTYLDQTMSSQKYDRVKTYLSQRAALNLQYHLLEKVA